MKKNLRRKIHAFLQSEEGKVSVKAPLGLSVMSGSFLLAQMVFTSPVSASDRYDLSNNDCLTFCERHGEELSCTVVCV